MKKETMGAMIAAKRKELGMTQLELAEKMGVTDKAVSKWERDLSCPDINSLPKLAEIFGISLDELMQKKESSVRAEEAAENLPLLIFRAVCIAMGVAVAVLAALNKLDSRSAFIMLGIGVVCGGLGLMSRK